MSEGPAARPRAIVVGTGFGGAVTAHRLVKSGKLDVVVLERGRRYAGNDFPDLPGRDEVFPDPARWRWSSSAVPPAPSGGEAKRRAAASSHWSVAQGLWDVRDLGGVIVAHAAGFGGGSLVDANVHLRAPADVFTSGEWPSVITRAALDPYYDRVAAKLAIVPITESPAGDRLPKTRGFSRAAGELKRTAFHPPLAVDFAKCTQCGECAAGCRVGAKNTLDRNYLVDVDAGADVRTLHEALWIERTAEGVFRVTFFDHAVSKKGCIEAEYVFLCAGAIGTTELLLRSKRRPNSGLEGTSAELGKGFHTNSDSIALAFDTDEPLEPSRGPTVTTAIVHREDGGAESRWLMVHDGGYPAALARAATVFRAPALLGRNAFGGSAPRRETSASSARALRDREPPFRSVPDGVFALMKRGDLDAAIPPQLRAAVTTLAERLGAAGQKELEEVLPEVTSRLRREIVTQFLGRIAWLVGPPSSAAHRFSEDAMLRVARWVQDALGARDPVLVRIARSVMGERYSADLTNAARLARWVTGYDDSPGSRDRRAVLLGMGRDGAPGRVVLDESGELAVRLSPDAQTYASQERLMRDVAGVWGAELRVNPIWAAARRPIAVHHQGGCAMGSSAADGVVDPWGEVFGCEGLFVFDGAALPAAVGVHPSSTIAAIAERNVEHFLARHGVSEVIDGEERRAIEAWKATALNRAFVLAPPEDGAAPPSFRSAPIGLRFTEVMTGFHAPAAGDRVASSASTFDAETYEAAYRRGRPSENVLTLTLDARIDDVSAFEADDEHRISLEGTVDFRWREQKVNSPRSPARGHARLFVPVASAGDQGRDRFLLYDLELDELTRGGDKTGRTWRLDGFKRMRAGEGTRAWADVTNLYAVVSSGDLRTYGTARLPLEAFMNDVLGKMRVTGTDDPVRIAWAMSLFGDVFFGHLADVYLPASAKALRNVLGHPLRRGANRAPESSPLATGARRL